MEFLYLVAVVLGVIVSILWILMPFAVFGIKSKLDAMTERVDFLSQRADVLTLQIAETNQLLRAGFNIPTDQQ